MAGKVLIVDDSRAIRGQIRAALERDGLVDEFFEAGDGMTALRLAVAHQPDLILCDLVMPDFDGTRFLMLHASHPEVKNIPVIMLTADTDLGRKAEILEKGASDYVTKPFFEKELLARVRVHLRLKSVQDELRRANAKLEGLAVTDTLTGLYNRRHLERLLTTEVLRTGRYGTPLSIILLDVDHFKEVNDTHGHAMGDLVLKNLAKVVSARVRGIDTVVRYGGEELLVVLPNTPLAGGILLAERLRVAVAQTEHAQGGASLRRTASFGVASFERGEPAPTLEQFVQRADLALYRAKQAGRDRVVAWDPSMTMAPASSKSK